MKFYNVEKTRVVNGLTTTTILNGQPLTLNDAANLVAEHASAVEGQDPIFGGYRDEKIYVDTPKEDYLFGWDGDCDDVETIAHQKGWSVGIGGNKDFELSFKIVECANVERFAVSVGEDETKTDKNVSMTIFKHYSKMSFVSINTPTTDMENKVLVQPMQTRQDFINLGFDDEDYECSTLLEVGEVRLIETETDDVRIIRVA